MPTYKTTFIFNEGRQGWSETWYIEPAGTGAGIIEARDLAITLSGLRKTMLGEGAQLEALRVSDVAIRGDSLIHSFNLTTPANPDLAADLPSNGMLARVEAGALYRRQMWLRGMRDDWIIRNIVTGQPIVPPALNNAFTAFNDELVARQWRLRCIDKEAPNFHESPVTAIAAAGVNTALSVTGFAALVPGDEVRVRHFIGPDAALLNRVWKVLAADAASITIPLAFATLTNPATDLLGIVASRVIVYKPVTTSGILRLAGRKTGRAFFVPRGRRRV